MLKHVVYSFVPADAPSRGTPSGTSRRHSDGPATVRPLPSAAAALPRPAASSRTSFIGIGGLKGGFIGKTKYIPILIWELNVAEI